MKKVTMGVMLLKIPICADYKNVLTYYYLTWSSQHLSGVNSAGIILEKRGP